MVRRDGPLSGAPLDELRGRAVRGRGGDPLRRGGPPRPQARQRPRAGRLARGHRLRDRPGAGRRRRSPPPGLMVGTPGYLSPEVLDGTDVGTAADWWGWGAVVAFAATGRPPFRSGPLEAVWDRVRRGAVDLEGLPDDWARLLRRHAAPRPVGPALPGRAGRGLSPRSRAGDPGSPHRHRGRRRGRRRGHGRSRGRSRARPGSRPVRGARRLPGRYAARSRWVPRGARPGLRATARPRPPSTCVRQQAPRPPASSGGRTRRRLR